MELKTIILLTMLFSVASAEDGHNQTIPLMVAPGVPLRLYLTKKVPKRVGAAVQAKILEPVYSFDREVIAAGTEVLGRVSRTEPVGKWQRAQAVMNGNFTPLRRAFAEFTTLVLRDGRKLPLQNHRNGRAKLNLLAARSQTQESG